MKTKIFFDDLSTKNNVLLLKPKDELVKDFSEKYSNFQDKFFYEQFMNSGGIVIDNWIRIYGCGKLTRGAQKTRDNIHY